MECLMNYNKKHSKIKNTGILFELLTRQITVDVLNGTENSKAVEILKGSFKLNSELGKEYELYKILIEKTYKTNEQANILLFISWIFFCFSEQNYAFPRNEKITLIISTVFVQNSRSQELCEYGGIPPAFRREF